MALLLEKGYCPYRSYETQIYNKYDRVLWKCFMGEWEEPSAVELKADLGRQIVSNLPFEFLSKNHGRFVAVTFTRKILAVCDTLEALNRKIAEKDMKENYYIARIGYATIAQI